MRLHVDIALHVNSVLGLNLSSESQSLFCTCCCCGYTMSTFQRNDYVRIKDGCCRNGNVLMMGQVGRVWSVSTSAAERPMFLVNFSTGASWFDEDEKRAIDLFAPHDHAPTTMW